MLVRPIIKPFAFSCLWLLTASEGLRAQEQSDEQAYRQAIAEAELTGGAYDASLPEHLLGLARDLQQKGKHREAAGLLRRGTHLNRINFGLQCPQQLPLLKAEVDSLIALGELQEADSRQAYRFRIQRHNIASEDLAELLIEQARWEITAYEHGLTRGDMSRLLNSWQLYNQAHASIRSQQQPNLDQLEQVSLGVLGVQYRIRDYKIDIPVRLNNDTAQADQLKYERLLSYKRSAYKRSHEALNQLYQVRQLQPDFGPLMHAQTLTLAGDVQQYYGYRKEARSTYQAAIRELQKLDDAEQHIAQLYDQPVPLPALPGLQSPFEEGPGGLGSVTVAFDLTSQGRVANLRRLDDNQQLNRQARRLTQQLKRATFRPRFAAGEPIASENITKVYVIQ